jgi:hypothetical protein
MLQGICENLVAKVITVLVAHVISLAKYMTDSTANCRHVSGLAPTEVVRHRVATQNFHFHSSLVAVSPTFRRMLLTRQQITCTDLNRVPEIVTFRPGHRRTYTN